MKARHYTVPALFVQVVTCDYTANCFEAAIECAATLVGVGSGCDVRICHGLPLGQGGDTNKERYAHAWVEARPPGGKWYALDVSHGLQVVMPRTEYYRIGCIDGDGVARFTTAEARDAIERLGHLGPWDRNQDTFEYMRPRLVLRSPFRADEGLASQS